MNNICLALSGGGIRAMAFHLGMLRYLSEHRLLEEISKISSVSGGSLLIGLILNEVGMTWPDSDTFRNHVFPILKEKLCSKSLTKGMLKLLLNPFNAHLLIYRANLLAEVLRRDWGITHRLSDLPEVPEISINGSTAETGKRFRFKKDTFGDYELGYADSNTFELAEALAVSAAFPGLIGPLTIRSKNLEWKKRGNWDDHPDTACITKCPYQKIHLYDGGVYDNLGLEPFFDSCVSIPKHENSTIIVSDASAPYKKGFSYIAFNPWRLKRVLDIMSEQTRALRVRGFHGHIKRSQKGCTYIWIQKETDAPSAMDLKTFSCSYGTNLNRLSKESFEKISEHAYHVTRHNLEQPK